MKQFVSSAFLVLVISLVAVINWNSTGSFGNLNQPKIASEEPCSFFSADNTYASNIIDNRSNGYQIQRLTETNLFSFAGFHPCVDKDKIYENKVRTDLFHLNRIESLSLKGPAIIYPFNYFW